MKALLTLLIALLFFGCNPAPEPLPTGRTWATELQAATDLQSLLLPVAPSAEVQLFSSAAYPEKVMLTQQAPQLFGDLDHGSFLAITQHTGYVEATLAEVSGPGMISWIHSANPTGTLQLYLDDLSTPALVMPFTDFIDGDFLPRKSSFSGVTAHGHNLHFPILFQRSCKVVVSAPSTQELAPLFYQVAINRLPPGAPIHTFNPSELALHKPTLKRLARQMQTPSKTAPEPFPLTLPPQQWHPLWQSDAPGSLTELTFAADTPEALAQLEIRAYWDGAAEPAFQCPLTLLAGVTPALEKIHTLPATVSTKKITLRWPMAFHSARLELRSTAAHPQKIRCGAAQNNLTNPMRFAAIHHPENRLPMTSDYQLNLATLSGRGRIVGCHLLVQPHTENWWGEGDPIIHLDTLDQPSWQSTGTEDYFGYAWCSRKPFNHPFRGQSIAPDGTLSLRRYHLLDRLPFQQHASFQLEVKGTGEGALHLESLILYYHQSHDQQEAGEPIETSAQRPGLR